MKKKNYKKAPINFRPLVLIIFVIIIFAACLKLANRFLVSSPLFKIKKITYPKTIDLPKDSYIFGLIGENLFSLDLDAATKETSQELPNLSRIRILRRLPDELVIQAQKRNPIAQVKLSDKYFYVDCEGVVSAPDNTQKDLPIILGVTSRPANLRIGQAYDDKNLKFALEIIQGIAKISYLSKLTLSKVNVSNLSRASFAFSGGIEVIVGEDRLKEKLDLLTIVILRVSKELDQIKYIDLRFKEPVIGNK